MRTQGFSERGAICKSPVKDMIARKQLRSATGRVNSAKSAKTGRARWSKRRAPKRSAQGSKRRRRNPDALLIRSCWSFRREKKKRPEGGSISSNAPLESRAHSRLAEGPPSRIHHNSFQLSTTKKKTQARPETI